MDGNVKYSLDASSSVAEAVSENILTLDPTPTPAPTRVKQIWAIGGGKGGVGKSLLASSLAIALSRMGNKVIAIDLDLGGANLHTALGVDLPKQCLGDYFSQRVPKIDQCVVPTGIPHLEIISGANDSVTITNIDHSQKTEFLSHIRQLDADYLIFDLGAGTSFNTLVH
jgi:flagellar biosynthesis protein FlhG